MKNKAKKILSTLTLTNIIVIVFAMTLSFSTSAFATDLDPNTIAALDTTLDTQHNAPCITEQDRLAGWIITFIEEPLSLKEDTTDPKLQSRLCYRSTLRFLKEDGTEKTITELANKTTGCSQEAEDISNDQLMVDKYKISYNCRAIMAILAKGGASYIEGYIGFIYRWAAGLSGLIAVAVIILSSIQISFAGGDSGEVDKAKGRILKSIAGLAVLFLSGLILYTVNPTFFTR